jgi:hypothetical protein
LHVLTHHAGGILNPNDASTPIFLCYIMPPHKIAHTSNNVSHNAKETANIISPKKTKEKQREY